MIDFFKGASKESCYVKGKNGLNIHFNLSDDPRRGQSSSSTTAEET